MRVVKVSGHQLDDPQFTNQLAAAVARVAQREPVVLINGGGKAIAALQRALGLPEEKVGGLRVTSAEVLTLTEMVMSAQINKLVVRALQGAGLDAVGLSGVDGRLLQAQHKQHPQGDLGLVGEIVGVRVAWLRHLLEAGFTPVISPVSCDAAGQHYNINADEAATAVAQALAATQLDFVSNVPGVWRSPTDDAPIPHLTAAEAQHLQATGIISGGMIPKVQAALAALEQRVQRVRIVDLAGFEAGGTHFVSTHLSYERVT